MGLVAIGDVDGVRGFVGLGIDPTPLGVPSWDIPTTPTALAVLAYGCFEVVGVGGSVSAGKLLGDCRSGRTLRFALTPSSARWRDRNASFSHEFMTSWVAVSKPCRVGLAV